MTNEVNKLINSPIFTGNSFLTVHTMLIDKKLLTELGAKAAISVRKRINYNFHSTDEDPLQRMLNVLQPESYVQPHKHEQPDKREAFIILTGSLLIITFNDTGEIANHYILNRNHENYGIEIPPRTYHTIIALEENTTVYEVKDGPYNPNDDKHFASWAPNEVDATAAMKYLEELLLKVRKATLS